MMGGRNQAVCMNLNTAPLMELTTLVGLDRAHDLVLWRPFLSWEEVAAVPGFDDDKARRIRAAGAELALPDGRKLPLQ